jgi:hypothetical protein
MILGVGATIIRSTDRQRRNVQLRHRCLNWCACSSAFRDENARRSSTPPIYPTLRNAHIQGVVILEAVLDARGA